MTLEKERCEACRADSSPVPEEEIPELLARIPDWVIRTVDGVPRLERTFRFADWSQTMAFVQQVGVLAEAEDHHPQLLVSFGRVRVGWWTHAIRALHRNDFIMAAKTNAISSPP